MKNGIFHFVFAIVLLFSVSCNRDADIVAMLDEAEACMQKNPESAFDLLNDVWIGDIKIGENQARYALLYSQAKDKCFIDETDDSLIRIALDYYEDRGWSEPEYLFLSYYYLGRVQQNAGQYTKAMLSYTKAEHLIGRFDNDFAVGLLYAQLGLLYNMFYDYPKSLDAFHRAFSYYQKAQMVTHQYYTQLNVGQILLAMKSYDEAEKILSATLKWAYANQESHVCRMCVELLVSLYEEIEKEDEIDALYASDYIRMCDNAMMTNHSLAYSYALRKDSRKAEDYLKRAWSEARNMRDTIAMYFNEYRIHKFLGNYKEALASHETVLYIQDTTVRATLQQPILTAQRDYFQSQAENNALRLKNSRLLMVGTVIIVLLLLFMGFMYVRHKIVAKDMEMNGYIDWAHNLEQTLFAKDRALTDISTQMDHRTIEMEAMSSQIESLFSGQYELLDKLTNIYYETHCSHKEKEAIYAQVKSEIERLCTDKKHIARLEEIVNEYKGDVMHHIREELPDFSEMDFRLLCFICAGFSAKAISIFTGDSTGNIYVKKSRLKREILRRKTPSCQLIVKHLS